MVLGKKLHKNKIKRVNSLSIISTLSKLCESSTRGKVKGSPQSRGHKSPKLTCFIADKFSQTSKLMSIYTANELGNKLVYCIELQLLVV